MQDNVYCVDCTKNSLITIGGLNCPKCNSENLMWNKPQEVKQNDG